MKIWAIDRAAFNQGMNAQYDISIDDSGIAQTLVAKGPGAVAITRKVGGGTEMLDYDDFETNVRRLTPLECCRLQGMPDWWCNDIPHSDSAEYKMWGNGMALPCALYVMEGAVKVLSRRWLESIMEVSE